MPSSIRKSLNELPITLDDTYERILQGIPKQKSTFLQFSNHRIIRDRGSKVVQFSHFSVKEHMTSDRLQISDIGHLSDYYIPLEPAHTVLAWACMAVASVG
jgi:hypothetical protein